MTMKEMAKNVLDTFGMSSTPADVEAYMRLVAWCWTALLICGAVWGLYKLISFVAGKYEVKKDNKKSSSDDDEVFPIGRSTDPSSPAWFVNNVYDD